MEFKTGNEIHRIWNTEFTENSLNVTQILFNDEWIMNMKCYILFKCLRMFSVLVEIFVDVTPSNV